MDERIIIRKAKISDFQGIHNLIMQVHKLHVNERNDIYKDVDPMNFEEFRTELSNSNNIYLIAELENEIVSGARYSHGGMTKSESGIAPLYFR